MRSLLAERHGPSLRAREFLRYLGPGLLVTVGFIDPGNWASNIAAGSRYGYTLLWVVTLSTVMLVLLQHNAAHLGIVTGDCLAESVRRHLHPVVGRCVLLSAAGAAVATALAEILGAAIALNMLLGIPLPVGAVATVLGVSVVLLTNTYRKIEKWIIGFVSVIGFCFLYELWLVPVDWPVALTGMVTPRIPDTAIPIVMSILGAVVMPHNLFLHSEIIQSRQWNLKDAAVIKRQLDYEFLDTLVSMVVGWAINAAIIVLAAATFHSAGLTVSELPQAGALLKPMLGGLAAAVFACALLFSGFASSITAGMAGGSVVAGIFGEGYNAQDRHSRAGIAATYGLALIVLLFVRDPFQGLVVSQIALSVQLPVTVVALVYLTSSRKVMGAYANSRGSKAALLTVAAIIAALNALLFADLIRGG